MAKRGTKMQYRIEYLHENGIKGTIPVFGDVNGAKAIANEGPARVPGCTISIRDMKTNTIVYKHITDAD